MGSSLGALGIEGDLDGAEAAGRMGVVESLAPAVQGLAGDGLGEAGDGVVGGELGRDVERPALIAVGAVRLSG